MSNKGNQKTQPRQKTIGVTLREYDHLKKRKETYEEWLGEKVDWGRFLTDMVKYAGLEDKLES